GTGGGRRAVDPRSDTARSESTSASSIISAIKARAARIAGAGFTQAVLVLRSEHEVANVVHLTSLLGEIAGEVARPEVHQLLSARGCQWQTHLGSGTSRAGDHPVPDTEPVRDSSGRFLVKRSNGARGLRSRGARVCHSIGGRLAQRPES